jgi:DNA-binding SARP family transcriptional activator
MAFIALHGGKNLRTYVAESLWADVAGSRARANLRSALWRLRESGHQLLDISAGCFGLLPDMTVDVRELEAQCHEALRVPRGTSSDMSVLIAPAELLPGWYEDWVIVERERLRQLRLYALEAACEALMQAGRIGQVIEVGLAVTAEDPLRESSQRLLIQAHAAEGNIGEAYRRFRVYSRLLRDELGLEPSDRMSELIRNLNARQVAAVPGSIIAPS